MKLEEFLKARGISRTAFARKAGLTVSTVHRAAVGKVTPSRQTIQAIAAATDGAVQPNDFFEPAISEGDPAGAPNPSEHEASEVGRYAVGVDIGGTFTDLMLIDRLNGEIHVAKVPSTPRNLADGVLNGLARLGRWQRGIEMLVHGTTVGLNAFLERKGGLTGLITTRGFRDVPEIGRHNRLETYDLFYLKPKPLVARRHRLEVRERIGPDGEILEPLDERDVESCIEMFRRSGVTTIAICLLHSYVNPVHEERVAALVADRYPEATVSTSSSLIRQWREYERGSTTIINAFIMPVVGSYLEALQDALFNQGYERPLFVSQSAGGIMSVDAAKAKPVQTIISGPAGGAMAAAHVGQQFGHRNIITFDMGGTSTDVALILDGKLKVTDEAAIDRHPILVSMIDIKSIGAGGGSIARIDPSGALNVGPESAGADPGPMCYGRGGEMPTVTDANLVLGRLPQHHFLGGEIELDMIATCREMERRIGAPLGLDLIGAASGVIEVINTKMAYAVRAITVERGLDPKDFILLPFGGAGPMHACAIARLLRIPEIVVPVGPGAFSAYGMLVSDIRHDLVRTVVTAMGDRSQFGTVESVFRDMLVEATAVLRNEGVAARAMRFERSVDMRYVGQEYTVSVPLRHDHFDESVVADLSRRFHRLHEQTYSHSSSGEPTEIVNLRLAAIGIIDRPAIGGIEAGSEEPDKDAVIGETEAYFHGAGSALRTQLVRRDRLRAGNRIGGPVIVTEKTATTVVEPGFVVEVMPQGHLIIRQEG